MSDQLASLCCINNVALLTEIRDLLKIIAGARPAKKAVKPPQKPVQYWQEMVDHISKTWERKKGSKYPFTPAEMKQLRTYANLYMPWGVMALWDIFLRTDDPFFRQTGYKIGAFVSSLPKLLDAPWKAQANSYHESLEPKNVPAQFTSLVAGLANGKTL